MDRERRNDEIERHWRRDRYRALDSAENDWDEEDKRDDQGQVPLKDQRRRHRDPEKRDERWESEHRDRRPRHGDRDREGEG